LKRNRTIKIKKTAELENKKNTELQHQKGKLTARERLNLLFDPETLLNLIH